MGRPQFWPLSRRVGSSLHFSDAADCASVARKMFGRLEEKVSIERCNANAFSRRGFLKAGLAGAVMTVADWRLWAAEEGLPDYYGEYLANVAARIKALSAKCDDGFFFITDLHIPSNRCVSGRILAKLIAETDVKKVLCGGDMPEAFGGKARGCADRGISRRDQQGRRARRGIQARRVAVQGQEENRPRARTHAGAGNPCNMNLRLTA